MFEVARVLYGSQNYGLDNFDSDKDYKVLMCPSFYDLYKSTVLEQGHLPEKYDKAHYSVMDARTFNRLLLKGNPNVLEMLFSVEWSQVQVEFDLFLNNARELLEKGYLALQWDNFYNATKGLSFNSVKRYGTDSPKAVSRLYFFYNVCEHLTKNNFAMTYTTWRNNVYCSTARELRFSKVFNVQQECEKFTNLFEYNTELFSKRAKKWRENHLEECKQLNESANKLNQQMYNFVKQNVLERLVTE